MRVAIPAALVTLGYLLLVVVNRDVAETAGIGVTALLMVVSLAWDILDRNGGHRG